MGRKKWVRKTDPPSKRGMAWPRWTGFRGKTVWDWLQLLIVPLMLALITVVFTWQQNVRQNELEDQRTQQAQKIENRRAQAERELAEQRAQDEALQAYLDRMNNLLLEHNLRDSEPGSEVPTLARSHTLTVLSRLDPRRKTEAMRFLMEAGLVQGGVAGLVQGGVSETRLRDIDNPEANEPVVSLFTADLHGVALPTAPLMGADLAFTDLTGADLLSADLSKANLSKANLSNANLSGADLSVANLTEADLSDATLSLADLSGADVDWTNLSGANLSKANLSNANLTEAELNDAKLTNTFGVSNKRLEQEAESLEGATMPDGQILKSDNNPDGPTFPEWLKSKARESEG